MSATVGGTLAGGFTVIVTGVDVVVAPALSTAFAVNVCEPDDRLESEME